MAALGRTAPRLGKGRRGGARGRGGRGLTARGEAGVEGAVPVGDEVEGERETSCTGKESCARGVEGGEKKREAVWGGGWRAGPTRDGGATVSTDRALRAGLRLGRQAGPWQGGKGGKAGWAVARLKGEEGEREKEKVFLFLYLLDEWFHSFIQSKQMHGLAWCNKQKKVFLGFTYTRSQTKSRYNFEEELGIARRKEKKER
jgi:hypothetical protein